MPDTTQQFFTHEVNKRCNLPAISAQDAFDLHHATVGLITGLACLRRLLPRLDASEVNRLVQTLTWQSLISQPSEAYEVATIAAGVVDSLTPQKQIGFDLSGRRDV